MEYVARRFILRAFFVQNTKRVVKTDRDQQKSGGFRCGLGRKKLLPKKKDATIRSVLFFGTIP